MSQVVAGKRNRKKQSTFQKLWARAAKLREQNEKFSTELDALVVRIDECITPLEAKLCEAQKPLVHKLLTLGQRKSMTNWERETLDDWIKELTEQLHIHGLVDNKLLDDLAKYDAFRMGIALEDDTIPPHEQFVDILNKAQAERDAEVERFNERSRQQSEADRASFMEQAAALVERELDKLLGPEPAQPEKHTATQDLWADELEKEEDRQRSEYQSKRAELREKLMAEELSRIDEMMDGLFDDDEDDDIDFADFDFSGFEEFVSGKDSGGGQAGSSQPDPTAKTLSNETFQRLFRAAAGKLHPDREPDPEIRKEKQVLMTKLLKARKKGDVMTVLELYEAHVGGHEGFTKADEKALTDSLKQMVEELEEEKDRIVYQSGMHGVAFHLFYSPSKKKVDAAFKNRLEEMKEFEKATASMTKEIRSLKTLKPWLDDRYQQAAFAEPTLEDFLRFVEDEAPF